MVMVSSFPGEAIYYSIVESTSEHVVINVTLPSDATSLTMVGTSVVPEFGALTMLVFAIPIILLVAITKRWKPTLQES